MKMRYFFMCLGVALLLQPLSGWAEQWQLSFVSRCYTTNNSGNPASVLITDRTIVRRCLEGSGISVTNARGYTLVYNAGADLNGDLIQVVNVTNGAVVCTPFRVLFQRGFEQSNGRVIQRLGFLYNTEGSDAVGSVVVRVYFLPRLDGGTRTVITGRMQFLDEVYLPDRLGVCGGRFQTTFVFNPPAQ